MRRWISTIIAVLVLLVFWMILAAVIDKPALPQPFKAFAVFFRELPGLLWRHLLVSTYRVLAGIALAVLTAVPFGLYMGRNAGADRFAAPLVYLVYPIPKIVLLPVIMVLLGLGDSAKIFLITLVLFFQVLIPVRDSSRHVPRALVDSVTSLGAGKWAIYRHVIWPSVLPEVLTALRVASGTAIAVLFFAETIACQEGLGYYLMDAWTRYAYEEMFAGIIAMGLLGFAIYTVLEFLEHRLCAWKYV
ncbi:MAG: ABC transporter permease [Ammonifex sp.]|nr:MAG: ABC transporter permease [Ammonifex sp.]